jgi:quercetin dioxygenase-like cupin family protein
MNATNEIYPDMIRNLPEADIPFSGIKGRLLQGKHHQIVFFDIAAIGEVAEHSHGAQWGIVVEGEMELTIGEVKKTYRRGDHYFIPAGVKHAATFKQRTWVIDFFEDSDRYAVK